MNRIKGHISDIQKHEGLCLIKVETSIGAISTLVIEGSEKLMIGNEITCAFKSTEAIMAKEKINTISLQNCFMGIVTNVKLGNLLAEINLRSGEYILQSLITKNAALQLDIKAGDTAFIYVKTNEVSLIFD